MLIEKEITEVRKHLDKSQNPIFLFDNDQDGLCSFLLLRRYVGRGKGVPIKSFPDLSIDYFSKIKEFNSDYIFILDKPVVSDEFFEEARKLNLPVVWIDHHIIDKEKIPSYVNYYNPLFNSTKGDEPVTALCYQISEKKEDLWLAIVGCVSDKFTPFFYKDFFEKYPDLGTKSEDPLDIYYSSQIGKISRIFGFGLKDRTTNVMDMVRFLIEVKSPYEVLEESNKNKSVHNRFKQVDSKYQKLLKKAISLSDEQNDLIFFQYGGDMSMSSDIANRLAYLFPKKIVVVAYTRGMKVNISMRGRKCRDILLKSIEDLKDARGGGHEDAVGGQIRIEDVERFRENVVSLIG